MPTLVTSATDDDKWQGGGTPYSTFASLPARRINVGSAVMEIAFAPGDFDLPEREILNWVAARARIVAGYYGRFPVKRLRLLVVPVEGDGVLHGTSFGYAGAAIKLDLGRSVKPSQLENDWILLHEMVHLAFPSQARRHLWIEEGLATYIEPIARVQAGQMRADEIWRQLYIGLPKGLPRPDDQGLDYTHTWGRTYWGGALFCLLADVEIHRRTNNEHGLQDALRAVVNAGGSIEAEWPLERVLQIGDQAIGVPVLTNLYEHMKATPVDTDLQSLWQRLGITMKDGKVAFDDGAPLAAVRAAITAPPVSGNRLGRAAQ